MTEPLAPSVGWGVLHLFCRLDPGAWAAGGSGCDADAVIQAVKAAEADGVQVVTVAMLGHKADLGVMALGPGPVAPAPAPVRPAGGRTRRRRLLRVADRGVGVRRRVSPTR